MNRYLTAFLVSMIGFSQGNAMCFFPKKNAKSPIEKKLTHQKYLKKSDEDLSDLAYCFTLSKKDLTAADIEKLYKSIKKDNKKSWRIRLTECKLGDDSALIIAQMLQSGVKIAELELHYNEFTNLGAELIINAAAINPNLTHLNLGFNSNTDVQALNEKIQANDILKKHFTVITSFVVKRKAQTDTKCKLDLCNDSEIKKDFKNLRPIQGNKNNDKNLSNNTRYI